MALRRGERAMVGVEPGVRDDLADIRDERDLPNINEAVKVLLARKDNQ